MEARADVEALRKAAAPTTTWSWRGRANLAGDTHGEAGARHHVVISEQANIRAGMDWAAAAGDIALALELVVALENFWTAEQTR